MKISDQIDPEGRTGEPMDLILLRREKKESRIKRDKPISGSLRPISPWPMPTRWNWTLKVLRKRGNRWPDRPLLLRPELLDIVVREVRNINVAVGSGRHAEGPV